MGPRGGERAGRGAGAQPPRQGRRGHGEHARHDDDPGHRERGPAELNTEHSVITPCP